MDSPTNTLNPIASVLEGLLKTRFDFMWVIAEDGSMWEVRFLIRLSERNPRHFKIDLSIVANRNACSDDLQHAAYLELTGSNDKLKLTWRSDVKHSCENALKALSLVYPLEQIVTEVCETLKPCSVEVEMLGFEQPLIDVVNG